MAIFFDATKVVPATVSPKEKKAPTAALLHAMRYSGRNPTSLWYILWSFLTMKENDY